MSTTQKSDRDEAAPTPVNGLPSASLGVPTSGSTPQINGASSGLQYTPARPIHGLPATSSGGASYTLDSPAYTPQIGVFSNAASPASVNTENTPASHRAATSTTTHSGSPMPSKTSAPTGISMLGSTAPVPIPHDEAMRALGRSGLIGPAGSIFSNGPTTTSISTGSTINPTVIENGTSNPAQQTGAETRTRPAPLPDTWTLPRSYDEQHFGFPLPGAGPAWELKMPNGAPDVSRAYRTMVYASEEDRAAGKGIEELRFKRQDQAPYSAMALSWAHDKQSQARYVMERDPAMTVLERQEMAIFLQERKAAKEAEAKAEQDARDHLQAMQAARQRLHEARQRTMAAEALRAEQQRTFVPQVQDVDLDDDQEHMSNIMHDARGINSNRADDERRQREQEEQAQRTRQAKQEQMIRRIEEDRQARLRARETRERARVRVRTPALEPVVEQSPEPEQVQVQETQQAGMPEQTQVPEQVQVQEPEQSLQPKQTQASDQVQAPEQAQDTDAHNSDPQSSSDSDPSATIIRQPDTVAAMRDLVYASGRQFLQDHAPANPLVFLPDIRDWILNVLRSLYLSLQFIVGEYGSYISIAIAFPLVAYLMLQVGYLLKDVHYDVPYAITPNAGRIFETLNTPYVQSGSFLARLTSHLGSSLGDSLILVTSLIAATLRLTSTILTNLTLTFTTLLSSVGTLSKHLLTITVSLIVSLLSLLNRFILHIDTLSIPQPIKDDTLQLILSGLLILSFLIWSFRDQLRYYLTVFVARLREITRIVPTLVNALCSGDHSNGCLTRYIQSIRTSLTPPSITIPTPNFDFNFDFDLRSKISRFTANMAVSFMGLLIWSVFVFIVGFLTGFGFRDFWDGFQVVTFVAEAC